MFYVGIISHKQYDRILFTKVINYMLILNDIKYLKKLTYF